MRLRPGLLLAAAFLCLYGTLALTVDVPKAAYGFKSDEATYYMIGLSLVHDGDLAYRKEDLARVWREYDSGPAGVFLKHGQKIGGAPDPDQQRYFYGKSFIYPLVAAPLVLVFGTNGFLLLNAMAAALVLLCAYLFLHARSDAAPSAVLAGAFVMEVVGEVNGRVSTRSGTPPAGTESRSIVRIGGRITRGTVRIDAGGLFGITSRDPSIGFTVGATWVFKGFTVP